MVKLHGSVRAVEQQVRASKGGFRRAVDHRHGIGGYICEEQGIAQEFHTHGVVAARSAPRDGVRGAEDAAGVGIAAGNRRAVPEDIERAVRNRRAGGVREPAAQCHLLRDQNLRWLSDGRQNRCAAIHRERGCLRGRQVSGVARVLHP